MPSEDNGAELLEPLEKQEMNDYYLFVTPGGNSSQTTSQTLRIGFSIRGTYIYTY